jgi:prepilin-type N-terminal cleavage/methylation domain-containing protein
MAPTKQGFTLVELVIAILVLTVGVLGLAGTSVLVSRMIARGQRAAVHAAFAARRLEMLRTTGCTAQETGTDVLFRGSTPIDSLSWRFIDRGNGAWQIVIRSTYYSDNNRWRSDSTGTTISCLR